MYFFFFLVVSGIAHILVSAGEDTLQSRDFRGYLFCFSRRCVLINASRLEHGLTETLAYKKEAAAFPKMII